MDGVLRLLHPFMPVVTEELWQALPHEGDCLATAAWPKAKKAWFDAEVEHDIAFLQELVVSVRNMRVEAGLQPGRRVPVVVRGSAAQLDLVEKLAPQLQPLARIERLRVARDGSRPAVAASSVGRGAEGFLPLEGLIDLSEGREGLTRQGGKVLDDLVAGRKKRGSQ